MAITFVDVSTYLVYVYGGPDGNAGVATSINLGIPNASAYLEFYPDGKPLPPNHITIDSGGKPIFYVSYRYEQLANVIDLFRNEKPIKFFFRDDNMAAYVTTAAEPIGEGEK